VEKVDFMPCSKKEEEIILKLRLESEEDIDILILELKTRKDILKTNFRTKNQKRYFKNIINK